MDATASTPLKQKSPALTQRGFSFPYLSHETAAVAVVLLSNPMVGSPFIYTQCGHSRTLLNTAHIAAVAVRDIRMDSREGELLYGEYDPPEGKIYLLKVQMV